MDSQSSLEALSQGRLYLNRSDSGIDARDEAWSACLSRYRRHPRTGGGANRSSRVLERRRARFYPAEAGRRSVAALSLPSMSIGKLLCSWTIRHSPSRRCRQIVVLDQKSSLPPFALLPDM